MNACLETDASHDYNKFEAKMIKEVNFAAVHDHHSKKRQNGSQWKATSNLRNYNWTINTDFTNL
jgi:hypothetical protein